MVLFTEGSADHENEDALLVKPSASHPKCWIGAIADGQGGCYGGAKAAQLACQTIVDAASELPLHSLNRPNVWWDLFRISDLAVSTNPEAGFTTLVAICVSDGYVHGASCGDSAAYLCQAGAQVVELTKTQQKNPQIGSSAASCTFFSSTLVKPWSLLLMTDGVWKYVGLDKIAHLLKTAKGQEFRSKLVALGRLPGSGTFPDDFTFALIEG